MTNEELLARIDGLITQWRQSSAMYGERYITSTKSELYVIAAQQGGLKTGFKVCADELAALRDQFSKDKGA